jgi:DnaJ-class molecular chaperone
MDFNKNYYLILGVETTSTEKEIKKAYYKLSFTLHPDKGGDPVAFGEITEAYDVLTSDKKQEYDRRSRWGSNYDESSEILNYEFNNNAKTWDEEKLKSWIDKNQLNILHYVDDTFNGSIEYERWVICKTCGGDGRDITSKIEIRDTEGNVRYFDGSDGCDFCEGSGKNWNGDPCYFCGGKGQVGWTDCKVCKGQKRILGKQKLSGIKIPDNDKAYQVDNMGHFSVDEPGKVGHLWIIKKEDINM